MLHLNGAEIEDTFAEMFHHNEIVVSGRNEITARVHILGIRFRKDIVFYAFRNNTILLVFPR